MAALAEVFQHECRKLQLVAYAETHTQQPLSVAVLNYVAVELFLSQIGRV